MTRDRKGFEGWKKFIKLKDVPEDIDEAMFCAWLASKAFYLAEVERFVGKRLDETESEAKGETNE